MKDKKRELPAVASGQLVLTDSGEITEYKVGNAGAEQPRRNAEECLKKRGGQNDC